MVVKINKTVRQLAEGLLFGLRYVPMGHIIPEDDSTQIIAAQKAILFHKTTDAQRYLVQRIKDLDIIGQYYLVKHDEKYKRRKLRIEVTPATRLHLPEYYVTLTTSQYNENDMEFSNYTVFCFSLSWRRISDVEVRHYHRCLGSQGTSTRLDKEHNVVEISDDMLAEIECGLLGYPVRTR